MSHAAQLEWWAGRSPTVIICWRAFPFPSQTAFLTFLHLRVPPLPPVAQEMAEMSTLPVLSPENREQHQASLPRADAVIKETVVVIAELNSLETGK